jgi:hypothetical protein
MKAEAILKLYIDQLNKKCVCKWDMPLTDDPNPDLAEKLDQYAFQKHVPDLIEHIYGTEPQFIIVGYDWMDDDLTEEETEKADADCERGWSSIHQCLQTLGYDAVDDVDGSGGGLYYGATLFKKVR